MTIALFLLLALAQAAPVNLAQVQAEPNPEHRAHAAVIYSLAAEKNAEAAYVKGDRDAFVAALREMQAAMELASDSLRAAGKNPMRNPKFYKYGEQKSNEILRRLDSLERSMDAEDREKIAGPKAKVSEIHDAWLDGIMSKQK